MSKSVRSYVCFLHKDIEFCLWSSSIYYFHFNLIFNYKVFTRSQGTGCPHVPTPHWTSSGRLTEGLHLQTEGHLMLETWDGHRAIYLIGIYVNKQRFQSNLTMGHFQGIDKCILKRPV